ncbi:hypothetical protein GQ54DRAFT_317311 [Martensiomyces pterosporus]|nr:hypothetical protein GQ54DRAFT_317311 [Martensiomyces pterosporus]
MHKRIREYPGSKPVQPRVNANLRTIREKLVVDVNAFVKRREYGKASDLLLIALEHVSVPLGKVWRPFIAALRQQEAQGSLGSYFDTISIATKGETPNSAALERIFYDIEHGRMTDAGAAMVTFSEDQGSKLALAHGYHGILIACLRELEIRERFREPGCIEPSEAHIFAHSESVQFMLSKNDPWLKTKFSLHDAESHLSRALLLDDGNDFFRAFYTQVLISLGKLDEAKEQLKEWYAKDKSVHVLRMLMAVDPRGVLEQPDYLLEYLELDPFASEDRYFRPYMERALESMDSSEKQVVERLFRMVVNRIELGDSAEAYKWRCMVVMTSSLRRTHPGTIDAVMSRRLSWWRDTYFSPHYFNTAQESDIQVYKAVCAQQLLDLEPGHPVYGILSGDLSEHYDSFVNENVRIVADGD